MSAAEARPANWRTLALAPLAEVEDEAAPAAVAAPNLPAEFWQARPELAHVRQAAHAAARSADAVLGVTLAHVATLTPPTLRLPAPVGTPGTLDVAVALIGPSGTGKSGATDVAGLLLPIVDPDVAVVSIGSGEGLIESYLELVDEVGDDGKNRKAKRQTRRAVLAMLDEGQALGELGGRKGSTLMPTIRSAWSGGRLGQANASEDRRRQLAPGEYRFALVAGFQTEHATTLLDDAAGGTPQRFAFFAASDPATPDEAPADPGPLDWRPPIHQAGPMPLDLEVAATIRRAALARTRGEVVVDPLGAHRDLGRLKIAGLLAILAGRTNIDANDWHLAGMVLDASDRVRGGIVWAAQHRAREAERVSIARHVHRATELDRSTDERALGVMARAIARHVHLGRCDGGCRRRCVSRSTPSKYRAVVTIEDATAEAEARGWIVTDGDTIRPGEARPA